MKKLLLAVSILVLAGVTPGGEEKPRRDYALRSALRPIRIAREADSIVLARIREVHQSPGVWCGIFATRQFVTYEVIEHLYGERVGGPVKIGHLLVSGSSTVLKDIPHLKWSRFFPGARAILCLRKGKDGWEAIEDDFGVTLVGPPRAPDPELTEIVRCTLAVESLRPYLHADRPGRVPVAIAISDATPVPLAFEMLGKPVRFAHPEALAKDPHFVITAVERDDARARIRFRYAVEGVRGEVKLARGETGWRVVAETVSEE